MLQGEPGPLGKEGKQGLTGRMVSTRIESASFKVKYNPGLFKGYTCIQDFNYVHSINCYVTFYELITAIYFNLSKPEDLPHVVNNMFIT